MKSANETAIKPRGALKRLAAALPFSLSLSLTFTITSSIPIAWAFLVLPVVGSCDDETDREEVVNKLRTIGVSADPFVATATDAAQTVNLTAIMAAPLGETLTYSTFVDEGSLYAQPLATQFTAGSETSEDKARFSIHRATMAATIPSASELPIPADPGFVSLRYGLNVDSSSGENERVVGNFVVFAAERAELEFEGTSPVVEITSFKDGETVSAPGDDPIDLQASITTRNNEKYTASWFVSGGKIDNRSAIHTQWREIPAGTHTVMVTIRGRSTSSFAFQVIDITIVK